VKASDLHLLNLLELRPDDGEIRFRNRRLLLWDADAFGNLRQELIDSLDVPAARGVLRRFGFANGYMDALTLRELFRWDDLNEWWLSCPALQRQHGKVRTEPQKLIIDPKAGQLEIEVLWIASYEAAQHLRLYGRSDEPVCWTLSGYTSGFSTAVLGEQVLAIEQECVAAGDKHCRVVGRPLRLWDRGARAQGNDYRGHRLVAELAARSAELRRKRRGLVNQPRAAQDLDGFVAQSRAMGLAIDVARTVARADSPALLVSARPAPRTRCTGSCRRLPGTCRSRPGTASRRTARASSCGSRAGRRPPGRERRPRAARRAPARAAAWRRPRCRAGRPAGRRAGREGVAATRDSPRS
jgi:hypothetical protein